MLSQRPLGGGGRSGGGGVDSRRLGRGEARASGPSLAEEGIGSLVPLPVTVSWTPLIAGSLLCISPGATLRVILPHLAPRPTLKAYQCLGGKKASELPGGNPGRFHPNSSLQLIWTIAICLPQGHTWWCGPQPKAQASSWPQSAHLPPWRPSRLTRGGVASCL